MINICVQVIIEKSNLIKVLEECIFRRMFFLFGCHVCHLLCSASVSLYAIYSLCRDGKNFNIVNVFHFSCKICRCDIEMTFARYNALKKRKNILQYLISVMFRCFCDEQSNKSVWVVFLHFQSSPKYSLVLHLCFLSMVNSEIKQIPGWVF